MTRVETLEKLGGLISPLIASRVDYQEAARAGLGVTELAVTDWDGDGQPEIFVLSADERQLGVSQIEANGRVTFPKTLPLEGRPLALAVRDIEASAHFYRDILGWRPIPMGEAMRGVPVAAFSAPSQRTHHELLLIEVGDLASSSSGLSRLAASVL